MNYIRGLKITDNFITNQYEQQLITNIKREPWDNSLKRRTQHYGYKYNYKVSNISREDHLGLFPDWLQELTNYIIRKANIREPNQVIINEYKPGQGIGYHVDHIEAFDEHICSLSLGSDILMNYKSHNGLTVIEMPLYRRSFLEMTDDARYQWKHGIMPHKNDTVNGIAIPRGTRYSITFRKLT